MPGVAVRVPLDEQGVRRRTERARAGRARDAVRLRGSGTSARASTRAVGSTRRSHSLFGASKAAADLLVQEYGRYFGMPTVCFRGGCLTGSNHASAELHGFLAYLARCVREGRTYRIYGYKGKQVRDNIHALDVCAAALAFAEAPRARRRLQHRGRPGELRLDPRGDRSSRGAHRPAARRSSTSTSRDGGDHICYISDLRRLQSRLPGAGTITVTLDEILADLVGSR